MAKYERGVYEPSDEVRVFDGAEEEDDAEGSRLPLLIVLALVVLCAFAGVVWLAYTQGVARGRTETPVLAAAAGPERVAPQNPGGAAVPYQGFKIYEQPAPADDEAGAASPPPVAKSEPPPQAAKSEPPPAPKPASMPSAPKVAAPPPKPAPAAAKPSVAPPPVLKQAVTSPPAARTAPAANTAIANGAPRVLPGVAPAPAKPPTASANSAAAKPAAAGAYALQIGAYKSQADADAAWKTYKAKHAALLSGYGPDVQKADLGDKGTWYRLRIAGFADKDVATSLCDRLKADGGSSCILGR
jgi:cell division protein FtsN